MSLPQSEQAALQPPSTGRQARSVAGYSFLTALMIVTPMLVFVPAALFHCALRNGRRAAWVTGIAALSLAAAYAAVVPAPAEYANLAWSNMAGVGLAVILPSLIALPLVERAMRFGTVVTALLAGGLSGLLITELGSRALLSFSPLAFHVSQAQKSNAEVIRFYRENKAPADMLSMMERWSEISTILLPAVMLIMLTLIFILSLLMLGRLKVWRETAAQRQDGQAQGAWLFRNFALPDWVLFAFVLGGITPLVSGLLQTVTANTLVVVAFLYIMQGLAIFRFALVAMGAGFAGTMLAWMLLIILTLSGGAGLLLLGVAGLFDPFFNFRHPKKRKDDSHESHSD